MAEPFDPFENVYAVLMAGGIGTRFWPLSTPRRPKQFLTELTDRSLYAQAVDRAEALVPPDRIVVMTNANFEHLVREQSPQVPPENIVSEPLRRDTAAAIVLAALLVEHRSPGAVMVVAPSDHLIGDLDAYRETMAAAATRAREGGLGTVGIPPTYPATGFGYLELAGTPEPARPQTLERFVEKPDADTARRYVESGRFLWNAGMFIWRAAALLEEARRHLPEMVRRLEGLCAHFDADCFDAKAREAFEPLEKVSIDFGVMEKADEVWTVPAGFEWSDVGGWQAAEELLPADEAGNRARGRVALHDTAETLVVGDVNHPVMVVGLKGCIVVHSEAGTLVCDKSAAQQIKPLVKRLLEAEDETG